MPLIATTQTKTENVSLTVTNLELGWAIIGAVVERLGGIDDAGCDWYTAGDITCIDADPRWIVSRDPHIARLVDAANILMHGEPLTMDLSRPE